MLQRIKNAVRIRSARLFPGEMRRISISAPIATVSFDDFPRNAWTVGGEIVEDAGGRATYYVSGSFCSQTSDGVGYFSESDLVEAHRRGHEVGCHTFSHKALPNLSRAAIDVELKKNSEFIRCATGQNDVSSFAYPYGSASIGTKLLLKTRFGACRGIEAGINSGLADFSQLRAVCLEEHVLRSVSFERLVEQTCSKKGWLILVTHDVSHQPTPFGCNPNLLKEILYTIKSAGIELVTVKEALARIDAGGIDNADYSEKDLATTER
jgi:peptidoglycan/xylan/chitin deacetylase (PgdA/CDA1 family)